MLHGLNPEPLEKVTFIPKAGWRDHGATSVVFRGSQNCPDPPAEPGHRVASHKGGKSKTREQGNERSGGRELSRGAAGCLNARGGGLAPRGGHLTHCPGANANGVSGPHD
ncbi:hypothetical protein AAFF_G00046190 [Aldrovandia affinis]|uniref:Uncharacterized protein n=1 Tax=Aldrovandia affinis TaxID=143900 RepID=A0AAD7WF12_9TELE|nr:hypothetical protein AAFF_G00046190 [Aldrovandia affinis]